MPIFLVLIFMNFLSENSEKPIAHLLLLQTNIGAEHGGAFGRYHQLQETAFDYAFLLVGGLV
jgi:protease II